MLLMLDRTFRLMHSKSDPMDHGQSYFDIAVSLFLRIVTTCVTLPLKFVSELSKGQVICQLCVNKNHKWNMGILLSYQLDSHLK